MPSPTTENYLKAIYALSERRPATPLVRLGELASELQVTPGTVTTMIRSLATRGLVVYEARKGVKLTEEGRVQALNVLRRHRLIELFLVRIMKMDWSEVHEDAEALEHAVSDRLIERMDAMMGRPTHDPHGDPIPTRAAEMPENRSQPLCDAVPGAYRVDRVNDQDPAFLEWMAESGLRPGQSLVLDENDTRSGVLLLRITGREAPLPIGVNIARHIRVEADGA